MVDNQLHGFGRWITVYWHGMFAEWIGNWDHGALNGYGRITYCEDTVEEGLYENSDIVKEEDYKKIKTYDL